MQLADLGSNVKALKAGGSTSEFTKLASAHLQVHGNSAVQMCTLERSIFPRCVP